MTRSRGVASVLPERCGNTPAALRQRSGSGVRPRSGPGILPDVVADARILALADAGKSAPEISDELGINLRTVQRSLAAAGRAAPRGRPSMPERERVQLRLDGDVIDELDARAEEEESTRDRVASDVLTAWAKRRIAAKRRAL